MNHFSNLRPLVNDLAEKGWTLACFSFTYKSISYVGVVKRFIESTKKQSQYALAKIEFINLHDRKKFVCEINSNKLLASPKEIREFFQIEYSHNLGDILKQLAQHINNFIPSSLPNRYTDTEKNIAIESLSKSDSEDPNKVYPCYLRRNSEGTHRTVYNSDKTKLIIPEIYDFIQEDKSVSCCYTADPKKERTAMEIIKNFSNK